MKQIPFEKPVNFSIAKKSQGYSVTFFLSKNSKTYEDS